MVKARTCLKARKAKKSVMLDDFCESTEYCRRYAARVLHQAGQRYVLRETILVADPTKHIHQYRPPRYGPAVQKALIAIWSASTFLGPVRLAAGMALFVENLVTHGHLRIDEETRRLLLQMSPATTPRLLSGERKRYRLHGISHTRSTPLRDRIPIQTCMDPPLDLPGVLAVDLVGHDGGQAVDDFNWTLTITDRSTGWTEAGAVRTKAEVYVVAALESCLRRYPGRVISLHADNGSEFMNGHLVRFWHTRGITFTRSRPYQGNDNAHVEEKNNSVIRKFVGYDRYDTREEIDLLNRLYKALHLLVNWFLPSQKLLHKERTGSHITKVYNTAQTPCAHMLARQDVPEETKKPLLATRAELDMTSLLHEIFLCQDQLDAIAKRRQPLVIKRRGSYASVSGEFTT
ncbi:integrase catalytic domain-containing protein [Candidatus Cryosericum septentrionale]|nr:DDE-type integrase/transposase/recombinase [Candidatus Cryosericum septentrionale]